MLILKEPQLGFNLALHLVHKLRSLSERVYDYSAFPVPVRIKKMLLRMAKDAVIDNNHFHIKPAPTHYEIAVMTFTHREAVSREFAILSKLGILKPLPSPICQS
jgi:CRP/FNR family transcriptional regulator, cyclic AMP receptor protein